MTTDVEILALRYAVHDAALRTILKLGDDLIAQTAGKAIQDKAAAYAFHADKVEKLALTAVFYRSGEPLPDYASRPSADATLAEVRQWWNEYGLNKEEPK